MIYEIASLLTVAALWGCTNPLIKRGSKDIVKVKADNCIAQFFLELKYLFTNYKYLLPMGLNQLGSVLYFVLLQSLDLSLMVPVANSLTFVFTAITGKYLGEQSAGQKTYLEFVRECSCHATLV
ncbi:transmembrane protein 234 homolog isoform X2 [Photinus pyralis]|uniref:transmembrane protein 234 homolog isoform X2 n=1 Tax=Photinus pyralis TaxID=7054 RepID=UPI001267344E|nr:transmembrane protein 234 homolog isoform X2 [Photinus pyralis]